MLRGRRSCAISGLPTPSSAPRLLATSHSSLATAPVTPLFPLLTRNAPVSPFFPLLTQKQGGGGSSSKMCSPLTLLFSYDMVTKQLSTIVGAPTFPFLHAIRKSQKRPALSAIRKRELRMTRPSKLPSKVGESGAGANREIHPAEPAGWSRVGVPGRGGSQRRELQARWSCADPSC
jgi:hypothetical protein